MRRIASVITLSSAAFALGALCQTARDDPASRDPPPTPAVGRVALWAPAWAQSVSEPRQSLADIAERVLPSIVNISADRRVWSSRPFVYDPFLEFFFGPFGSVPEERRQRSLGSGVVASADGFILTNAHVVAGAESIRVELSDRRRLDARVVGADDASDVAVLKVEAAGLRPLPFGDSTRVRAGDVVLAIGNPFGLGGSVTMGIVSATGRANVGVAQDEDFIQTDAAINPGNSGGALVSLEGRLIGLNCSILSRTGGYQGIGFAVPSDMVRSVFDQIRRRGRVARASLGIEAEDVTPDRGAELRVPPSTRGAAVTAVASGGPAERAGILVGDVVASVGGRAIEGARQLLGVVAGHPAGSDVVVELQRGGERKRLTVRLGERPPESAAIGTSVGGGSVLRGLTVAPLTAAVRREQGLPAVTQGVVVTDLGSRGARLGLERGDVILQVNGQAVDSPAALEAAVASRAGGALLLVRRRGVSILLAWD